MPGLTLHVPPQVFPPTPPPKVSGRDREEIAASSLATPMPVSSPVITVSTQDDTPSSLSPDAEPDSEEHVLSSYGDLSFTEGFILSPTEASSPAVVDPIQPRHVRPRLRLKVRRPPMPKRRLSYVYAGGPFTGSVDRRTEDGEWPGSPDPFRDSPRHQHQPLVSPLSSPKDFVLVTQESGPQRGVDVSVACLKSPQISVGHIAQKGSEQTSEVSPANGGADRQTISDSSSPSSPVISVSREQPKPHQEKPASGGGGWRTRLPPRPPLPKWDV
ncbi:hypothetical protein EDD15DRAFT_2199218 [Pisolithus albus]|nr:hypothetical protein EDD15DRAFT_2199218 [Pisolithus albus]